MFIMNDNILAIHNLHDLVDYNGRKLFGTEQMLENVIPEWIYKAGSVAVKNILRHYLTFVQQNLEQLKMFIVEEGVEKLSRTNQLMQAFILDIREQISDCTALDVKDACLLSGVRSINHYKIQMYGTMDAYAKALGNSNAAAFFHQARLNEELIDDTLSELALTEINTNARNNSLLSN